MSDWSFLSEGEKLSLLIEKQVLKHGDAVDRMFHFIEADNGQSFDYKVKYQLRKALIGILSGIYKREDGYLSHLGTEKQMANMTNVPAIKRFRRKVRRS